MEWNVIRYNINSKRIESFNIFKHGGFNKDVLTYLKECETKEEFDDRVKSSLMYHFWCKSEWEVVVYPWIGGGEKESAKIDVYWQVMNNWDMFVDYVWQNGSRG